MSDWSALNRKRSGESIFSLEKHAKEEIRKAHIKTGERDHPTGIKVPENKEGNKGTTGIGTRKYPDIAIN